MKKLVLLLAAGAVWFRAMAEPVILSPTEIPAEAAFAPLASTPPPLPGPDFDKDGLSDLQELRLGTDPTNPDTDGDGFSDGQEYTLRTDPLARDRHPIFLLSTNSHQRLLGETLIIRPTLLTNFIVVTNVTITNIPPVYEGTPIDSDDDGTPDSCDVDGDGVADTAELCPITTPGSTRTNTTVITNYIQFQWFAGTNPLPTQTNANLVLLDVTAADAGLYHLEAALLNSQQTSDDVPMEVIARTGSFKVPVVGKLVAWGNNLAGQTSAPPDLTNIIQVAPGFLHSAALRTDGSVAVWGDSGFRQTDVPRDALGLLAITSGSSHLLGLRTNGTVMGWGANQYGQASPPSGLSNVVAISAGYFHSVALLANGSVVAWGDNAFGQTNIPGALPPIRKISAGMFHTVALAVDGSVICWGSDAFGQSTPGPLADQLVGVVDVAAGGNHSVALRRDGIVLAWGNGSVGQSTVPANLPKAVEIAAGFNLSGAVTHEGKLVLWGDPALLTPPTLTRPTHVAGGYAHGLALDARPDSDGDLLDDPTEQSRGTSVSQADSDRDGVLDGIEVRLGSNPLVADTDGDGLSDRLELLNGFDPSVGTERPVGSLQALPAVELEIFTSGRSQFQLQGSANGSDWVDLLAPFVPRKGLTRILTNPTPSVQWYRAQRLGSGSGQEPVEGGAPGTVRARHREGMGQQRIRPDQRADQPRTRAGARRRGLAYAGAAPRRFGGRLGPQFGRTMRNPRRPRRDHRARRRRPAFAGLRSNGEVVGWGSDAYGQASPPLQDLPATAIAAGGSHSLALLVDGTVIAWGANESGQAQVPAGLQDVVAISAGRFHSVALRADGTVVAWGDNRLGQLTVRTNLPPIAAIAAGFGHTAAVTRSGNVVCWGSNVDGQCDVPAGLSGITAVLVGNNVTIARDASGRFTVWGANAATLAERLNAFGATAAITAGGGHIAAANTAMDADSDGVDDVHEASLGMNSSSSDSDGDGLDDQTELLAGFNPVAATESADGTVRTYDALKLRFFTLGGETWRLERTTDFTTWRTETALRPSAQFSNLNGFTEVFVSLRNRDAQVWRLLRVLPAANP